MGWNEELLQQLMVAFEAEAREHLQRLPVLLVELEREAPGGSSREERIAEIFRLVHSLKGAARAVDLKGVESLSHRMESLLGDARSGRLTLAPAHFDLLLRAVDALDRLVTDALGGEPAEACQGLGDELEQAREPGWTPTVRAERELPAAAAPAPAAQPATPPAAPREEETIRVPIARIDELLGHTAELLAARIRLDQLFAEVRALADQAHRGELQALTKRAKALSRTMARDRARLGAITQDLQEGVMALRLVPVDTLFQTLPRMVRDLAREQSKAVALELSGGETPVDKRILEQWKDPVIQLVTNALDHGIEPAPVRLAAGKPAQGTIRLHAWRQGGQFLLSVTDDGAGIDLEAVKAAALRRGLAAADLAAMDRQELLHLIFRPGFSTRSTATELSGRGVGLDVVRRNVDRMHGRLTVEAEPGRGMTITLAVPLVVTHAEGLLVRAGGQLLALPANAIDRVERVRREQIRPVAGGLAVPVDGRPVTVVHLAHLLNLAHPPRPAAAGAKVSLVVLAAPAGRVAFWVDELAGQQEMVIKSLGAMLIRVPNVAGATILGSGQPVIVLDPADLVRSAHRFGASAAPVAEAPVESAANRAARLLVVDDSITTRTLERTILEAAGYQVVTAADGQEAWTLLQSEPFDLVVTDVEMPRMDGFGLTAQIRGAVRLKELPVVLVTSRESREDKERGIAVGADAYLVKRAFDQDALLEVVRQLI